ncbi:MAG: LrgB family protein [Thiotrichales bacterium]
MNDHVAALWVYLSASPILHLTLTVLIFVLMRRLYRYFNRAALLNPVMWTILILVLLLKLSGTSYETYFEGAQFVHFLLGPATVALAVPLYRQLSVLKRYPLPLLAAVVSGSFAAMISAILLAKLGGLSTQTIVSIAPKSVTTPVAMGIAEQLGGLPSLTAVLVILTGIMGAVTGPWLLQTLRIKNAVARGLAMGVTSHGIGTARAVHMGEVEAAFAGLAIGLNGLLTAIALPLLWVFFTD